MGCCCSSDVIPDIPKNRRPDPPIQGQIDAVVVNLGTFFSRDYGVWDRVYPQNSSDRKDNMWLWLNKSDDRVELENFDRKPGDNLKKGRVLYAAFVTDNPHFDQFNRLPNRFNGRFTGIDDGYNSEPDDFYLNKAGHRSYQDTFGPNHYMNPNMSSFSGPCVMNEGEIITKWRLNTTAKIVDGNTGRGAPYFGQEPIHLEVFSKGTVVTTYFRKLERVEIDEHDNDGNVTGHRYEMRTIHEKKESEFVDHIEYRLSFRGQLWGQWWVKGDTFTGSDTQVVTDSPFFTATLDGGWFKTTKTRIVTKTAIDPALALLIGHLVTTEYSIAAIKKHLQAATPPAECPPHPTYPGNFNAAMGMYQSPFGMLAGQYTWGM
jgi:hypothetical protein